MAQQKGHTEDFSTVVLIFTPRPQRPLNYRPFYRELHQRWKLYRDMGVRDQSQHRPWKQQLYPTRSSRPQSSSI